jgi:glycosyltransferase involved in cell wall biosynthesis
MGTPVMTFATSPETISLGKTGARAPRVSIGLPVYNGSRYLRQALDSVLAQSFQDFELVISDNASTDDTEAICRACAAQDARVRYYRVPQNQGVTWNFRQVVARSSGEFFLWMAHDDMLAPDYVERCLEALHSSPAAVLCYAAAVDVDEAGRQKPHDEFGARVQADSAHIRFRDLIRMEHLCEPIFGLMRSHILKKTPMHADFPDSDRCLLAELALYGPFCRIEQALFFRREHSNRVTRQTASRHDRMALIRPGRRNRLAFPYFRQLGEYLAAIYRAPLPWSERLRCYFEMTRWVRSYWRSLLHDLRYAASQAVKPFRKTVPVLDKTPSC